MAGILEELTKDDGEEADKTGPHKKSVMDEFDDGEADGEDGETQEETATECGQALLDAIKSGDPKAVYEALEKVIHAK
jgi:hypothetical protein